MSEPTPKLVILDRDGVINADSDDYIKTVDEWTPLPGSIAAIAKLSQAGYRIAVATNQSGLARGYFDEITLANMHNLMCALVEQAGGEIDVICYCPHLPTDDCYCRKPKTGLLEQIGDALNQPVQGAWLVGDHEKDLQMALAAGCKPLLVRTGKGAKTEAALSPDLRTQVRVVDDLAEAARVILHADATSA
ncbi:MAG TPA: D-glycero-beta-D-manno-heptose 1,7-bisphosphate 7-phosphatase [Candidatus Acidoferrum sp.]|nr:D-glycero-beta-D-manno-heptose 1,7-bisphosphate 7-phosphatase [Candidatus Acidoferrum sp.]